MAENTHKHPQPLRRLSLSPPALLPLPPLPRAIRQNRSFANLAKLIGLASDTAGKAKGGDDDRASLSAPEDDDEDEDEDDEEDDDDDDDDDQQTDEVDEESLMWDAQVRQAPFITPPPR